MANVSSLMSSLEGGLNAMDNREGKIKKVKSKFGKKIGVSDEMVDKAEDLIDTFDDMDKAYEEHKEIVEDCDKEIQKLTNSISSLQVNLGRATTTEGRNRIQSEIDKKQRELIDKQSKREVNARKRDEAETKRDNANRRFDKLFGRRIAMGDITALNNKNKAVTAISKGGKFANMAKGLKNFKGGPWGMAIEGLVKAIEFGIGKATEYARTNSENLIRHLNVVNQLTTNDMKASIASWQDAVSGAYVAQDMSLQNQQAMLQAQNATTMASMKLANTWTNWIPIWGTINKYQETVLEMEQKIAESRLANATKIIQQVNEFTKLTDDYLRKQDNSVHQYQTQNGLTVYQTKVYENRMLNQAETFAKYNKTIEDIVKIQSNFIQQSGRVVNFSNEDMEKSLAAGRLVGDDTFTQFSANMNIFNKSVSSSADIMYDMYNYANKMGISTQKLTKNVMNNLKLANKYDFKNGTKGFFELTKWAENVRFNLNSLGGMLEKIQSGGLEGTVENTAKLQVLGGNFAMGADPLAVMWESFNDPATYAKRVKGMFKGLGSFNSETGETTFGANDAMLIRNAAEALGMSIEDAKDMIREDNKKETIHRQVHNNSLSREQMDAVSNKAQRDEDTGHWVVNMLDGTTKDISSLTPEDLKNIVSDNNDENMSRYAQSTLSSVEKIESATKFVASLLGGETFDNYMKMSEKSATNMVEAYTKNADSVSEAIMTNRDESLKAQLESYGVLGNINTKLNDAFSEVHQQKERIDKIHALLESKYGKIVEAKKKTTEAEDSMNVQYNKTIASGGKYKDGWDLQTARSEYWYAKGAEEMETGNWLSGSFDYINGFLEDTIGRVSQGIFNTFGGVADGAMTAQGVPMTVAASSITPIHDGSVKMAKTDPKDSAIFAKTGGPFDTLFNKVFNKVDEIYSKINSIKSTNDLTISINNIKDDILPKTDSLAYPKVSKDDIIPKTDSLVYPKVSKNDILPKVDNLVYPKVSRDDILPKVDNLVYPKISKDDILPKIDSVAYPKVANPENIVSPIVRNETTLNEIVPKTIPYEMPVENISHIYHKSTEKFKTNTTTNDNQTIDVKIHGDLKLSSEGKIVDISRIIETDPLFIKRITELILNQIDNNIHGGKQSTLFHTRPHMQF